MIPCCQRFFCLNFAVGMINFNLIKALKLRGPKHACNLVQNENEPLVLATSFELFEFENQ